MALLLLLLATFGCQGPFGDDHISIRIPPERLRAIDTLELPPADESAPPIGEVIEPPPVPPPQRLELTLEEARALALEHNLELRVQLLNPTIARQSITEEEARFDALLTGGVDWAKSDTPISTTLEGSSTEALSTNFGVDLPLTTGGRLSANLPVNRFATDNEFSLLNPAYTSDFSLAVSQPLLRGAGIRVNTSAIRIAQYQTQATEARTKLEVIGVVAGIDRMYWLLYATRRELEVRRQELELARQQLASAQRRVDSGDAAEVEVIRAEAGVAERLEAIIIAENTVRDAQRLLKRAINKPGLTLDSPTEVVPVTEPAPMQYALDRDRLMDAALAQRMELLELQLALAIDGETVMFARNQLLPVLDLTYVYGVNGLGGSLDDSLEVLKDKNFEDHRVSVRGQMPLGNRAAKARLRSAILSRIQRLATKASRELLIRQEVLSAADAIEAGWQRIAASRQRTILAARTLAAEQRQFDLGLRTSTDVLDAQARLADARSAELRAVTDYEVARTDLAVATGTLLGAAKVRWAPAEPEVDVSLFE